MHRQWRSLLKFLFAWLDCLLLASAWLKDGLDRVKRRQWTSYCSSVVLGVLILGLIHGYQPVISQSIQLKANSALREERQLSPQHNGHSGTREGSIDLAQRDEQARAIPVNPHLADSPWPIYHRNTYAQASTPLRGLEPQDSFDIDVLNTNIDGASPWTQLSETYPDGTRVVWGATVTHVFKATANQDSFELIDSYRIDRNRLSNHWNLIVLSGNKIIVPDPWQRKIYKFAEADPDDWRSDIILEDTFDLPRDIPGRTVNINLAYDGWLVFLTTEGYFGALSPDFSTYRSLQIPQDEGEINFHNNMALDEVGGVYIVTTDRLLRVNWRNQELSLGWSAPYDFRGPGCANVNRNVAQELFAVIRGDTCTGSGTTPSLMGVGNDDKLVLVADGHTPANHMVALWRERIPADWTGIPGYDRRVAAVTALPYSTPDGDGFTAENSPTVHGYDIAIAQYNGFRPECNPVKGVQKLRWNPQTRSLEVIWATDEINFNNVPTYSEGSNLVYGTGRRDCVYHFWGLNWDTGAVEVEIPLGDSPEYLDQGNQITINDDRTVFFASSSGLVRIRPQ